MASSLMALQLALLADIAYETSGLEAGDTAPISTNETCTVAMTVVERLSMLPKINPSHRLANASLSGCEAKR